MDSKSTQTLTSDDNALNKDCADTMINPVDVSEIGVNDKMDFDYSKDETVDTWLESTERESGWEKCKRSLFKNILSLSLGFLFLFTAFQALSNLQSSINCDDSLGFASLSCIYASLIVSSSFLPPIIIRHLGTKWTLVICMICYVLYTCANYYPEWYTLIPASVLLGFAAAPLWTSKATYLTTTSSQYAELSHESSEIVINRNFGVFFMFFQSSQIWGNLMSSVVLGLADDSNSTEETGTYTCGADDCQKNNGNDTTFCNPPARNVTNLLITMYLVCGIIAIIIIIVLLDKLNGDQEKKTHQKPSCNLFLVTLKLLKDYRMELMIPLTIYSGLEQAFIAGDFTKSYVSCVIGVEMVGYIMICYGVSDTLFSFIAGYVAKYIGRVILIAVGTLIHLVLIVSLLLWEPRDDDGAIYFTIAIGWGMADAIWQTQINTIYGILFSDDKEAAFSNYRLWESVGFTVSFAYSIFICVYIKLYILIGVLIVGVFCYFIVEYKRWKNDNQGYPVDT
ncbi:protein unc-93 homolog A-like [Saccoglossus kowalevskii]|uniref:Protein unc-93 homolog A-like n=1 Tax=Saccoglossus kowalevskii TaxID=10224 RepID=A0ABM0MXG9_SACKO|nr:PREDICTED: protein unc-93 homolog A-like [Saccoglossus kowalevskii]